MTDAECYFAADPAFWTPSQQAAFRLAHALVDNNPPGRRAAVAWRKQKSRAFRVWREKSRSERKRLIAEEVRTW